MNVEMDPRTTLAVLRNLRVGWSIAVVSAMVSYSEDAVTQVARDYGWPDASLDDAIDTLQRACDQAGQHRPPVAPPQRAAKAAASGAPAIPAPPRPRPTVPEPPSTLPTALLPEEKPQAAPRAAPPVAPPAVTPDVLKAGLNSEDAAIRRKAERAVALLREVADDMVRSREIIEVEREIARLRRNLEVAEVRLASLQGGGAQGEGGAPRKRPPQPDAKCQWSGCGEVKRGRTGLSGHMRARHGVTLLQFEEQQARAEAS